MERLKNLELSTLLSTLIVLWALFFFIAHGPIIFVYLAFHICTSGLFCYLIFKIPTKKKTE